jgi:HlyD family secretion protein
MDRPIDPQVRRKARMLRYGLVGGLALAAVLYVGLRDGGSQMNVDRAKVTLERVRHDVFQDFIAVIGSVEPIQIVYLDATEGGRVEEIFIREGTTVKKGDDILRISNDNLVLQIANYETEVARAINDLRSMRVTLENQQFSNASQLIEFDYEITRLERDVANNEQLLKNGGQTRDAYLLAKESLEKKRKMRELLAKKSAADTTAFTARITAAEEMVESMQKNLGVNRSRLRMLMVKAPVNGELATLNPELGQVVAIGTRIGTINVLDSYKIRAEIDEHYIARITSKLKASCEFSEQEYPGTIAKVYPEVKAGKFAVDLVFADKIPPEIRIGQTSRVRLELGESRKAVLVPRGGFYQSTGGQWIFVVDPQTRIASKRSIKLGRQNPNFYEVLDGLAAGEEVITSGYDSYGGADRIALK